MILVSDYLVLAKQKQIDPKDYIIRDRLEDLEEANDTAYCVMYKLVEIKDMILD